jgi:hypothetical protein
VPTCAFSPNYYFLRIGTPPFCILFDPADSSKETEARNRKRMKLGQEQQAREYTDAQVNYCQEKIRTICEEGCLKTFCSPQFDLASLRLVPICSLC